MLALVGVWGMLTLLMLVLAMVAVWGVGSFTVGWSGRPSVVCASNVCLLVVVLKASLLSLVRTVRTFAEDVNTLRSTHFSGMGSKHGSRTFRATVATLSSVPSTPFGNFGGVPPYLSPCLPPG